MKLWGNQMVAEGAALNEYITAGRYPGDIAFEDIGKAEAAEALGPCVAFGRG